MRTAPNGSFTLGTYGKNRIHGRCMVTTNDQNSFIDIELYVLGIMVRMG